MVPVLSHTYFQEKLPVSISYAQASVLLCMGLQHRDVTYIEVCIDVEIQGVQIMISSGLLLLFVSYFACELLIIAQYPMFPCLGTL